ncbi:MULTISPECIES: sulfur oxidation c-type cytochrome SoxX [Salipiger]|uniref:Monoheme cytochrome c SoxX n=1 Tax=Salipiger bermudensis (strain DSM 26914 / JCM 13377 / KCTC 12554 / HTCC2601) TaxID=314265 RepID=Q0FI48_SALBH|nr:sulfur oxidation c-type cytochrome SoxX [Salipiger bermudensis]MAE91623.1 sulfur oxidation c-type cytochrome SoxX [Pelagibaca sp.]MBR9893673.1 sulfur oxidation c-type cytochrome SoxX [bacterium]EAU43859.1 monoheme cytochrome c SoxX [Salipiger bermudensis HTCC2601]MBN9677099.1 sulfur oxidation c-type cytochrome SoxX [Salipiger bermudensis]MCA1286047.1 sulfur oxidation c-type cytochrome SoxX [Salipiger bermudensis]
MKLTALTLAGVFVAGAALANGVAPDEVTYGEYGAVEASLSGAEGNADKGREIFSTKSMGNCVSCHAVSALPDVPFQGEVGPMLDGVGGYRSAEELRGIVANAKMTFEGTVMPAFYKTSGFIRPGNGYTGKAAEGPIDPILSAQDVEDVVAFLMTLQD